MASPIRKSSFVGGEWAPALHARIDLEAYRAALKTCRNFTVRPQGGVVNRPGTQLSVGTKNDQRVMLLPFVFNQGEAYILEFGDGYIRFVRNAAQVLVTDATPTIASYSSASNYVPEQLTSINGTNPSLYRAQAFVSELFASTAVYSIRIIVSALASTKSVQVAIYTDSGGLPLAAVPGLDFTDFVTLPYGAITHIDEYFTFPLVNPLAAPVLLATGTVYHVVVRSDDLNPSTGITTVGATTGNGYAAGAASKFYGGAWHTISGVDLNFAVIGSVTVGDVVEVPTTYTEAEAAEFKGRTAQSADVMFIPHHLHDPAELQRHSETSWGLSDLVNGPGTIAPGSPTFTGSDYVGSLYNPIKEWWYVVTAIDAATGNESFGSIPVSVTINISTVTPAVVTIPAVVQGASGYNVYRGRNHGIYGYVGTVDGLIFHDDGQAPDYTTTPMADPSNPTIAAPSTPTPGAPTIHSALVTPSQGTWWWAVSAVIAAVESFASVATSGFGHTMITLFPTSVTFPAVFGATSYKIYRGRGERTLGYIGTTATTGFLDTGTAPNYALPPILETAYQAPGAPPITFTEEGDRPSCAAFMDQRLIFGGTDNAPDSVFSSRVGNYRNFNASSPAGDDDAFEFTLAALTVDRIRGLVHSRVLMAFTGSSEYAIQGTKNAALGPSSIDAKAHAHYGSGDIAPLPVGGRVLFSQLEGKAVREFRYDFQQDGYTAEDERSVLAKHLLDGHAIIDWAYAKGPDSIVWMVRDDGVLLGMTYLPQHDVIAWHRHDTDGLIESVACIPEGDQTAVYVAVARIVNGATKRFIERFATRQVDDAVEGVFLDCSLTYHSPDMTSRLLTFSSVSSWLVNGTATATITGQNYFVAAHVGSQLVLHDSVGAEYRATITGVTDGLTVAVKFTRDFPAELQVPTMSFTHALKVFQFAHMIGETVTALVDGNVVPDLVVDSLGDVTLPYAGSVVTIGKPYVSELETLDINVDGRSLQTVNKVVGKVWLDFVASRGLWVGEPGGAMREWKQRRVPDGTPNASAAMPLFTGRDSIAISGGWNKNGRVVVQQRDPLPCEITSITPEVTFGG